MTNNNFNSSGVTEEDIEIARSLKLGLMQGYSPQWETLLRRTLQELQLKSLYKQISFKTQKQNNKTNG